jgi:hypothetical protein
VRAGALNAAALVEGRGKAGGGRRGGGAVGQVRSRRRREVGDGLDVCAPSVSR